MYPGNLQKPRVDQKLKRRRLSTDCGCTDHTALRSASPSLTCAFVLLSIFAFAPTEIMADPSQPPVPTAFAPPPPLWKHFTRENLDKLEHIKAEASKDKDGRPNKKKEWSPAELRALEITDELRYLVPPDIPTGQYSVFGELQTVCSPT